MDLCACSLTMYYIEAAAQLWPAPFQLLIYHRNSSLFGNKPFSPLLIRYRGATISFVAA